ncbi:hypothetical protein PV326_012132, partial [Microctonus aethiopoides]
MGGQSDLWGVRLRLCASSGHLPLCGEDSFAHEKDSRRKKGKTRNWWEAREELGTCERSGDVYFDYCGICWMMEGKWGMDHPSGDPF